MPGLIQAAQILLQGAKNNLKSLPMIVCGLLLMLASLFICVYIGMQPAGQKKKRGR